MRQSRLEAPARLTGRYRDAEGQEQAFDLSPPQASEPNDLCHVVFHRQVGEQFEVLACASADGTWSLTSSAAQEHSEPVTSAARRALTARMAVPTSWQQELDAALEVAPLGHTVEVLDPGAVQVHRI